MTKPELIERAKRQLSLGPESEVDLGACVMQALSDVSHMAMKDDSLRGWLQQTYPVTLDASGVGDLLAAVGDLTGNAGEILIEGIRYGVVIDADNNILQPLTHYSDFLRPQPTVYAYYCLKDREIHTRALGQQVNSPVDVLSVTGPLSITASFTPTDVGDIPPELEEPLIHSLVRIFSLKTYTDVKPPANAYAG